MPARWIISKPVDLTLVIGSSLAGYLFLFAHVVIGAPFSWLWWFWSVGFDGTHIFATVSRTYLDRDERRRNGALLWGSLIAFFSLGPLLVLAGWKLALAIFVGFWAYYHVLRQHYGFLMLYKVKHRDLDPWDNRLDTWFLALMLAAPPILRFLVRHPEELGIPAHYALGRLVPGFELAVWLSVATVSALYARRLLAGRAWNKPKLLLLAGIVPLHWLTFNFMSWQAAVPTVTIVHNLQYHAIVWFHNRNKYAGDGAADRYGSAPAAVARSLTLYLGLALVFSLLYRVPGFHLGRISDIAFGLFCGFGFTHYYLDSKIWRVRQDASLRETLRLAVPAVA
ncbi:MAG: hypothetical protein HY235_30600 [Acidobacteria bacterium]|nr:hypothetical protein [Acidobacteriota bacterium]